MLILFMLFATNEQPYNLVNTVEAKADTVDYVKKYVIINEDSLNEEVLRGLELFQVEYGYTTEIRH